MSKLQLKSVELIKDESDWRQLDAVKAKIEVTVNLGDGQNLEQTVTVLEQSGKWYATVSLDDHPGRDTPEEAVERLGEWLAALSKPMKKSYFRKFRLSEIFKPTRTRN